VSIIITNTGNVLAGKAEYVVRINNDVVCTYYHKRTNGLAACLAEASKAVGKAQWEQMGKFIEGVQ